MDFDSREFYRKRVAMIARRSDCTETQVAQTALELARQGSQNPQANPRIQRRLAHVGYYLIDKGFSQLAFRVGFHPPVSLRLRQFLLERWRGLLPYQHPSLHRLPYSLGCLSGTTQDLKPIESFFHLVCASVSGHADCRRIGE